MLDILHCELDKLCDLIAFEYSLTAYDNQNEQRDYNNKIHQMNNSHTIVELIPVTNYQQLINYY